MERSKKRVTIGLLVSGIMDEFTESICKGVMYAAEKADVNLVVLPCKYLDRDLTEKKEIMYEYQYNTLFSYARKDNLDGLLVSADSIGCYTTKERIRQVLQQYEGLPTVLLASKLDGYVSVNYDNYTGIKEGIEFLIHNRGCKRFCMLGGPDDNTDAFERKQAFFDVLKKNGIVPEERNFVEGTLSKHCERAFRELLDKNPDAEAIFCVNDDTAIGVYEELKRRKKMPGKDVYVLGYDNTITAMKLEPFLSSVWADSAEVGEKALEIVLRMLSGEAVTGEVLKTKFIKRASFGNDEQCEGEDNKKEIEIDRIRTEEYFEDIFYRCKHEDADEKVELIRSVYYRMMDKVFLLFEKQYNKATVEEILWLMEEFLTCGALEYADIDRLIIWIEKLQRVMKQMVSGKGEQLWQQEMFNTVFRKIINAMDYRFGAMKEREEAENYSMKIFVGDIMQFEKGSDQSYAVLLEHLNWLDIKNACVYLFEKPMVHLDREEFELPKYVYLKAVLKDGKVKGISATHQRKKFSQIYDNGELSEERHSMALLPLFSNEILYGIVLCDMTAKLFDNGEFLINQMSSAVKMINLLRTNEKIQQQLEESLVTLKENNIVLDNLSKSDGLTGILNRRGFQEAAEEFLEGNRQTKRKTLVAYVDMNNLKIINDRYGHEEGDFSLKLIGDILVEVVAQKGIVGRIGGDEFACAVEYPKGDDGNELLEEIQTKFHTFNKGSDKPYNITVSAGVYVLDKAEKISLKEALALADEKLYEAKQHRVKTVAKQENVG